MTTNLKLGWFELCLNVSDISNSVTFYERLGFEKVGGSIKERCVVMQYDRCRIALYQGYINNNLLNFRGGDVFDIAQKLKDQNVGVKKDAVEDESGNRSLLIEDPDGNEVYFVFHPGELPPQSGASAQ